MMDFVVAGFRSSGENGAIAGNYGGDDWGHVGSAEKSSKLIVVTGHVLQSSGQLVHLSLQALHSSFEVSRPKSNSLSLWTTFPTAGQKPVRI